MHEAPSRGWHSSKRNHPALSSVLPVDPGRTSYPRRGPRSSTTPRRSPLAWGRPVSGAGVAEPVRSSGLRSRSWNSPRPPGQRTSLLSNGSTGDRKVGQFLTGPAPSAYREPRGNGPEGVVLSSRCHPHYVHRHPRDRLALAARCPGHESTAGTDPETAIDPDADHAGIDCSTSIYVATIARVLGVSRASVCRAFARAGWRAPWRAAGGQRCSACTSIAIAPGGEWRGHRTIVAATASAPPAH